MSATDLSDKRKSVTRPAFSKHNLRRQLLRLLDWRLAIAPLIAYAMYQIWLQAAESGRYPAFMLPHPDTVWLRFEEMWADGSLQRHLEVTLREALYGLFFAAIFAFVLGYFIARIRLLNYVLIPYLIFLQAIPVVAIAPIIIIWVGPDIRSKIVIAALITWFPLMVSTIVGIRNVSPQLRELMRANRANPFQVFWHLELPSAMPEILGGLKIAVTLSVIGAAVGELYSATEGLGFLVFRGRNISDPAQTFIGVILLTAMSLTMYTIVSIVEHFLLRWKRAGQ
jgi:NitT/TauT family transport system permease protein